MTHEYSFPGKVIDPYETIGSPEVVTTTSPMPSSSREGIETVIANESSQPVGRTIESNYVLGRGTMELPHFDASDGLFIQFFKSEGMLSRAHRVGNKTFGMDMIRKKYAGVIRLIGPEEQPALALDLELPEHRYYERPAELADAISFSDNGLLKMLVENTVKQALNSKDKE